jgi:hypothetical protein
VHTLSHTEPLQCSADDMWEAVKYSNVLLPAIDPDYITKSFYLEGYGEPGSIRILQLGPGIAQSVLTALILLVMHQCVLVAYNFGLATTSCNADSDDATVHFNNSKILSVWDS